MNEERKLRIIGSDLYWSWSGVQPGKFYAAMMVATYRIQVKGDGRVSMVSWGLANDVEATYDNVDALPQWMQRKIAVLMLFDADERNDEIAGLGRRISKGTFWVYPTEGEDDGDDTRTPSEELGS